MKNQLSQIKLGILGGGQLARMMALKSHEMGIKPHIFSSSKKDPAVQVTPYFTQGEPDSKEALIKFFSKVDLVVFENEFFNPTLLQEVSQISCISVHPKPKIMARLQDRLSQKKYLKKYNIPTVDFIKFPVDRKMSTDRQIATLAHRFPKGIVLKKRRQGYDGQGTLIIKNIGNKKQAQNIISAKEFMINNQSFIVEERISFKRELAVILVRNRKKQIVEFPLVETRQEQACCVWVKGPCHQEHKNSLVKKLKNMMDQMDYEGVMAFELFETKKGVLLVNEIAPRVHNSGHYSLDALSEDQFSLHIKAVLNMDIGTPVKRVRGFAMLNLLGDQNQKSRWLPPAGVRLHWYGKTENRPGRKMGHLNSLSDSPNKALKILLDFKRRLYS